MKKSPKVVAWSLVAALGCSSHPTQVDSQKILEEARQALQEKPAELPAESPVPVAPKPFDPELYRYLQQEQQKQLNTILQDIPEVQSPDTSLVSIVYDRSGPRQFKATVYAIQTLEQYCTENNLPAAARVFSTLRSIAENMVILREEVQDSFHDALKDQVETEKRVYTQSPDGSVVETTKPLDEMLVSLGNFDRSVRIDPFRREYQVELRKKIGKGNRYLFFTVSNDIPKLVVEQGETVYAIGINYDLFKKQPKGK